MQQNSLFFSSILFFLLFFLHSVGKDEGDGEPIQVVRLKKYKQGKLGVHVCVLSHV